MDGWSKKLSLANIACLFSVWFAMPQTALAQSGGYSLSYSGRLTQADGAPVSGPVDVTVKFWSAPDAGNTLGTPIELTNIALNQGVFTIPLDLNPARHGNAFVDFHAQAFLEHARIPQHVGIALAEDRRNQRDRRRPRNALLDQRVVMRQKLGR